MFLFKDCEQFSFETLTNRRNMFRPDQVVMVLNDRRWNLDAYVVKSGVCFFKGTPVPLHNIANNSHFYVSDANTAGIYARRGYGCTFKTKRDHLVIVLNQSNIEKILTMLDYLVTSFPSDPRVSVPHITELVTELRVAYGVRTTPEEQFAYFASKSSNANMPLVEGVRSDKRPGRVSFTTVDKHIMQGLQWLFANTPLDVQGVIAFAKHSPAHGGKFHPELAYFQGSNVLRAHTCTALNASSMEIKNSIQYNKQNHLKT